MGMYTESIVSKSFKQFLTIISPELNTRVVYCTKFKKRINLENPRTLDEKIQWLKLHTYLNNPLVKQCADKNRVREYVRECGCAEILNDQYFTFDNVDDIQWNKLPNKFVLKWDFGCGKNLIVYDKSKLDIDDAKKKLKQWYKSRNSFYLTYSEMQYKDMAPKLLCEKLIETQDGNLPVDYKVYCFNGKPDSVLVCTGRGTGHVDYYFFDKDWKLKRYNKKGKAAPEGFTIPRPENVIDVFKYAELLCKPFPFVRADFYLEQGKVTFGELTFTPCGGFDVNRLPETQLLFGDMVDLNYKSI